MRQEMSWDRSCDETRNFMRKVMWWDRKYYETGDMIRRVTWWDKSHNRMDHVMIQMTWLDVQVTWCDGWRDGTNHMMWHVPLDEIRSLFTDFTNRIVCQLVRVSKSEQIHCVEPEFPSLNKSIVSSKRNSSLPLVNHCTLYPTASLHRGSLV